MNKGGLNHKIFYILIPVGAFLLAIVCNFCFDKYHQIKLDNDTKEILEYLMTKEFDNEEVYKSTAIQLYKDKGYDDADFISVILGDDYLVLVKYHYFNDLKVFLNIFNIQWTDKSGLIDDDSINSGLSKRTGHAESRYIARLNEYQEPVITKFDEDENEFFLQNQNEQEQTTEVVTELVNE